MVRTHPCSRFVLKSLVEIRDSREIILQIEQTKSNFTNGGEVYLCEVVNLPDYNRRDTMANSVEKLTEEIVRVNNENTRLQRKVERLSRLLEAAKREARAANGGTAV